MLASKAAGCPGYGAGQDQSLSFPGESGEFGETAAQGASIVRAPRRWKGMESGDGGVGVGS